jgi:uncharacterized protein (TIGR03437 family)
MWAIVPVLLLSASVAGAANPPLGASRLVSSGTAEAARFSGVGRMGGCTAFLILPAGAAPNAQAYVMSAGHCVDLGANDVILDRPDSRTIVFGHRYDNAPADRVSVGVRRIVYSTMKRIDVALFELNTTLDGLQAQGIRPFELAAEEAALGEAVEWAGIPVNGIPSDEVFLRTSTCTVSGRPDVIEWRWTWWAMLRNDCSDIQGGASGSPLLSVSTGRVIGVLTTGNAGAVEQGGEFQCWRDNPCEIVSGGYEYVRDTSYATSVSALALCFDASGAFSMSAPGCGLDPGGQPGVLQTEIAVRPGARWNASVATGTARRFRYKVVREGDGDCRSDAGYSSLLPVESSTRITDQLPSDTGRYHLCVAGEGSPVRFATVVHVRVDATPPAFAPEFALRTRGDGGFFFEPRLRIPELAGIRVKLDAAGVNTCGESAGYRDIYPVPLAIGPEVNRLCLIAYDLAGNAQNATAIELRAPAILPAGVVSAAAQAPGAIAPASWISIFGLNLTSGGDGTRAMIRDEGGREWPLEVVFASPRQLNARVPEGVRVGPATVTVTAPDGAAATAAVLIEESAPGLFTPNGERYGVAAVNAVDGDARQAGYSCSATGGCVSQPLPAAAVLEFVAGGFGRARDVSLQIAGYALEVLEVTAAGDVHLVRARVPEGVHVRGFLPVRIGAGGRVSRPVYIWLR